MVALLGWILTAVLALFGINSASHALRDLLALIEAGLEIFAWPLILGLGYIYAARLRKWRDQ